MSGAGLVRGRYAPSPTGELHLGNVRTALVAWLGARAAGGEFVLRVEDLDPPRVIPGAERRLVEDLGWLGFDWDEGPDVGGPHAAYRQSERSDVYRDALERVSAAGLLYGCTCSRAELRSLASAPHGPGTEGPPYPGVCRDRGVPLDTGAPRSSGSRTTALRFRAPSGEVAFEDALCGRAGHDVSHEVGDFVVRRADGLFSYQLAVVVDDALMGITQVVRGVDLLHSTPRQIALQRALSLAEPSYAHVGLALGPGGERLAKRDGASAIRALRERGVAAGRVVGVLAHSLGLTDTPEPATPRDLVGAFSWDRIRRDPWQVDAALFD